ncbi:anti-sigma factor family protein [Paludibaculum fermentans]|uniref:anti-sigma factor family protein n=1 Tax=Paludibaculum fermentans TaxID=1473598 RepID=UPI003EBA16DB
MTQRPGCPLESEHHTQLLMEYCAGRLDEGHKSLLEEHIANCLHCLEFCKEQQRVWTALDGWEPEPVDAGFDARLMARIEARPAWQSTWRRWLGELSWKPVLPAAAVLAAYFVVMMPQPQPQQPLMAGAEVQQVEQALQDLEMLQQLKLSNK